MSRITRVRGDNYPIEAILTINKAPINLTGATVSFSYIKTNPIGTAKTINGTIVDAPNGKVMFSPTSTDFSEAGSFKYDIQHTLNGITTTHLLGVLILEDDITKA